MTLDATDAYPRLQTAWRDGLVCRPGYGDGSDDRKNQARSKPLCIEVVIGHTVMVTLDDRVQLAQTCLDFIEQLGESELVNDTRC